MTKMADLAGIAAELRAAESFLVTSHSNPDGDAIGSILATYHFLRALGKTAITCVSSDPVPRVYQWLPGASNIVGPGVELPPFEVAVVVDVARRDRFDDVAKRIGPEVKVIVIDHHIEERPCGHVNFVDPSYAAVGEILVELFAEAGVPIPREAAVCAYVAQVTDTGGYRFSNTNARSHRIAAMLVEAGVDVSGISHRVFDVISVPKVKLLERVLAHRGFSAGGRVAWSELTVKDMTNVGATGEDLDGLANYLRNIEGVEVGILFQEIDAQSTKVSLRSQAGFNCADFLQQFGGGGHPAAAGGTLDMPLCQTRALVLERLSVVLDGSK